MKSIPFLNCLFVIFSITSVFGQSNEDQILYTS